ncbi:MAG TPA: hypothetical protein VGB82_00735 [Alphaproteobacteria bacterium]
MIEIAHSIRGRLRIIVRDPQRAVEIRAAALAMSAVTAAALNPVTGSLVITYEPAALSADELWSDLQRCVASLSPTLPERGGPGGTPWVEPLVAAAVNACVRYVVERSAALLLAAVI